MVRVDEITKEKAKYLKQVRLTPAAQEQLSRTGSNGGAFAVRRAFEANGSLPVLRLPEEHGCNFQIAELLVLTGAHDTPVAVLAIDDKWVGPEIDGAKIYFGGKVHFF